MKNLLFISEDKERALIQEMTYRMKMANLPIHPSDTCFLMVSPDYSAVVTQHLSHSLSVDREIFHIEAVNVPFPDEDVREYRTEFTQSFMKWQTRWDKFVLIEAGVIRGGNYTWICDVMTKASGADIWSVALCENIHSKFKSDFVSLYYDDNQFDLHFWWNNQTTIGTGKINRKRDSNPSKSSKNELLEANGTKSCSRPKQRLY